MRAYLTNLNQFFSNPEDLPLQSTLIRTGSVEFQDGTSLPLSEDVLDTLSLVVQALSEGKSAHLEIDEELVTPERAGELLGVSRQTIYSWQDSGRLEMILQGTRRMSPLSSVLAEEKRATAGRRLLEETLNRRTDLHDPRSPAADAFRSGERWAVELARLQDDLRILAEEVGVSISVESEATTAESEIVSATVRK